MTSAQDDNSRQRGRPFKTADELSEMTDLISETAQRLFHEEGYAKVSIRRLAKEVGCSPMTLYKYYDGKLSILQTLWAVVFRELFSEMRELLKQEGTPTDRLKIACRHYAGYWLDHPEHYRLVFMAEGVTQPEVSLFVDDPETIAGFELMSRVITEASTVTDEEKLKIEIDLIMATLHGIAQNKITIAGYAWSDANAMIDYLFDHLMKSAD
jgi:AcrR family transcriptional regulator